MAPFLSIVFVFVHFCPLCFLQAVPLAQKIFRVEADSLHLTLVGRFMYDVMHFVTEAREIASVLSAPTSAAVGESQPQQSTSSYRPITEVRNPLQYA